MIFVEVSQLEIKSGRVSSRNAENGLVRQSQPLSLTVLMKFTSPSWRFASAHVGSEFFRIITASITISTFGGGWVKDFISARSFLFKVSSA